MTPTTNQQTTDAAYLWADADTRAVLDALRARQVSSNVQLLSPTRMTSASARM